jgi:hypothetical protein
MVIAIIVTYQLQFLQRLLGVAAFFKVGLRLENDLVNDLAVDFALNG